MRMMKNNKNETIMVIGIDHGYGNVKTATRCFPSGVARYDKEPIFQNKSVGFKFRNKEYHVEFAGTDIYPHGFAAAFMERTNVYLQSENLC